MKIIDEKGRLFGRINVIDFLVIIFLFCLTPVFYFGYRLFKMTSPPPVSVTQNPIIEAELNFNLGRIRPEILKLIAAGDKEMEAGGAAIGEIIEVGESKPYQYNIDIGGEIITKDDPVLKAIPARLKLKAEIRDNELYYKSRKIALNSPIEFKTAKYTIEALPTKKEIKEMKMSAITKIDLNVTLKNLDDDILKLISEGDKALDKDGEVIAEILTIGKKENNVYEINLGSGTFVRGDDSIKKQLSVKLRLKCQLGDDYQLYFKGNRVTNNSWIELNTDKYAVKGKVAMTYESPPILLKNRRVDLAVKFTGIIPEVANIIKEGDLENDPENKMVGRLKSIISNRPSEILVFKEDRWITVKHPFQKDVVVILEMLCIEKDGILYFKNYPVKMGNSVTFTTGLYSISGVITGIEYF